MTMFFKLKRSREELARVEVEMHRLKAHIAKERERVNNAIKKLDIEDPPLAFQLRKRRDLRRQIDDVHAQRFERAAVDFDNFSVLEEFIDEPDAEGSGDENEDEDEDIVVALDTALNVL